ncbi:hypothetical protein [Wolbachia endosymbiont (group A) of Pipizella viduata]
MRSQCHSLGSHYKGTGMTEEGTGMTGEGTTLTTVIPLLVSGI